MTIFILGNIITFTLINHQIVATRLFMLREHEWQTANFPDLQ